MAGLSPTQRTLAYLKARGCTSQVVERWNAYAKVRIDLFGCIDIISISGDVLIGIQCTSGSSHSARIAKSLLEPRLKDWLGAGALFEVWSWQKRGPRGKRKLWSLRRQEIYLKGGNLVAGETMEIER